MRYLKAALVGLIGGFLFEVAVTAIGFIVAFRELESATLCGDYQCFRAAFQPGNVWADRAQVWIAFVVGYAAAFGWFVRRPKAALLAVSGGALLALAVMTIDATIAGRLLAEATRFPCPSAACTEAHRLSQVMFDGTNVLIAIVLGYAATFAWFVRRRPLIP